MHTEACQKKRATIIDNIRKVARHIMRVAKQKREVRTAVIVPSSADYTRPAARFTYTETPDQIAAVEAGWPIWLPNA